MIENSLLLQTCNFYLMPIITPKTWKIKRLVSKTTVLPDRHDRGQKTECRLFCYPQNLAKKKTKPTHRITQNAGKIYIKIRNNKYIIKKIEKKKKLVVREKENFPCKDSLQSFSNPVYKIKKKYFKMYRKTKLIAHDLVIYFLNYLYCFNYKIYINICM